MKKKKIVIIVILAFVALVIFGAGSYVTNENEYSVVKQFGKIVGTKDDAGFSWKIPFVQTISKVPKATQLYDLPASEAITSDKKTMIVDAYVLWKVTDVKDFTKSLNASTSTAEGRIDVIVYNAIKTTISSMTQEELIASRDSSVEINIVQNESDVEVDNIEVEDNEGDTEDTDVNDVIFLSDKLLTCVGNQCKQYGIEISDIKIKVLDLPDENKDAVYQRMITERNNIAAAYKAQGESAAQIIKNTTNAEITVILSEAQAKADEIIAEGEAEYMKILSDAYNDPDKADFYLYTLEIDSIKKSLANGQSTIVLDSDSPVAKFFEGK